MVMIFKVMCRWERVPLSTLSACESVFHHLSTRWPISSYQRLGKTRGVGKGRTQNIIFPLSSSPMSPNHRRPFAQVDPPREVVSKSWSLRTCKA